MDHSTLIERLMEPAFYDHSVDEVHYIQTHISSVFLTGDFAYKLKKPVNFGFLDFSTVELRREFCEAEVRLNRRLAPSVYLRVAAITDDDGQLVIDGSGEVVDWLVVMRQMDNDRLGPQVLARGELDETLIDGLVERLVPFYREAATGDGVDEFGRIDAVRFNTDENFAQTADAVGKTISRTYYDEINDYTERFLADNRELFERRIAGGMIRESHGDLHLGNIVFDAAGPLIFDCIEFNQRFRCGDVAVDLAFLAMDLDFRGRPELSERLISRYVELSGDHELPLLLDFYRCYRAYVRGKIACFTAADPAVDETVREQQFDLARRYFGLAHRYSGGSSRAKLLVIYGLMGTGKTSLARFLGEVGPWNVLGSDAIRKSITGVGEKTRVYVPYNEGLYSPAMNEKTYAEMNRRAESLLNGGLPVVMDGCFKTRDSRVPVLDLAARAGADVIFVETTCEPEEQRRRLLKRQAKDTSSDGRVELIDDQRADFESPDPDFVSTFHSLSTDTTREETRQRMKDFLAERGIVS